MNYSVVELIMRKKEIEAETEISFAVQMNLKLNNMQYKMLIYKI